VVGGGVEVRAPFVGRQDELAWLDRTLDRARRGRPGIALVVGEMGIGKTRLLREVSRRARRLGFRTLSGAGYADLQGPFFPFVDALDDAVRELAGAGGPFEEAGELIDVVLGRRPAVRDVPAEQPASAQVRVLRALTRALFELSRRTPAVLTLDDLHWADSPSLQLLQHLALRLDDELFAATPLPLLVVGSGRVEESGPWQTTLQRLRGEEAVSVLRLGGLTPPEVGALVQAGAGEVAATVVDQVARITAGNPLYVESLVANLGARGLAGLDESTAPRAVPATVLGAVARRFAALDQATRRVLEVVAVTCGEADAELVAGVLAMDRDDVERSFAVAVDAGLLGLGSAPDFTHPSLRQVALGGLPRPDLAALHAAVLDRLDTDGDGERPERLARHALGAGDRVDPELRARLAADAARVRLAAADWAAAAELFDAARALGPKAMPDPHDRADVELSSGMCRAWAGFTEDDEQRFRRAAELYEQAGDVAGVALAKLALVRARITRTPWGRPVDTAELAAELGRVADHDADLAVLVQADLAMGLWVGGRSEEADAAAVAAAEAAEAVGSAAAASRAFMVQGVSRLTLLRLAESRAALERGLEWAVRSGDPLLELMVTIRLPLVTGLMGDTAALETHSRRALALADQVDGRQDAEFAFAALCSLAGSRGDALTCEEAGAEVRTIARMTGSPWAEPFVLASLAAARGLRGDAAGAAEAAAALLPDDPAVAELVAGAPAHRILQGYLAVLAGDLPTAAALVTPATVRELQGQPAVLGNGSHLGAVVEVARALGDAALVAEVAPALADLLERGQELSAGMPFLLRRSLGVARRLLGDREGAGATLEAALRAARRERLGVEEARCCLDLADLAADAGDRRRSSDLRARAGTLVEELELWALAGRAGVRPPLVAEPVRRSVTTNVEVASGRSVVLFADISASTALTEELGDVAFRHRARRAEAVMRAAVAGGGGRAIEGIRLGDGILAEFPSAGGAVRAGLAMIEGMADVGLEVHVGVHAGPVIRDAANIFGGAVNLAARICDAAGPGRLHVSSAVLDGLDHTALSVTDLGDHVLKGVARPIRLHAVSAWADSKEP
jgi:class 3 adenylate cyclase